jgi:hypothetical protein
MLLSVREGCLAPDDLTPSMGVGDLLRKRSVQGLIFPSAVGRGKSYFAIGQLSLRLASLENKIAKDRSCSADYGTAERSQNTG